MVRFGHDVAEKILDRRRRILSFAPGSVFAFVRWAGNDFGTVLSRIDILRAIKHCEAFSTVPFVSPGGEIYLRQSGWPKVERVLQAIDAVEQIGVDPVDACPDHWRNVHNRLVFGEPPRPYTRERHRAGSSGKGSTYDALLLDSGGRHHCVRRQHVGDVPAGAETHLERQRQRADRSLRGAVAGALPIGELLVVAPPEPLAAFLDERHYLPKGVPLLKHVAALPGQTVCRAGGTITVDGIATGVALGRDHLGRRLPTWQGCRVLAEGEIFLMNRRSAASLDGRYFGPLPTTTIVGRADSIWIETERQR